MKIIFLFLLSLFVLNANSQNADLDIQLFASNLNSPVNIKHAGDNRLFVVEQDGFIKIINADGSINPTLFLDIDDRVIDTGGERGLLGLAFHPDYVTNGYFFVNYINLSGDTVISRFSRNASNPSLADPNSELIILTYAQPFGNHNGGDMAFGNDGFLYISSGDGGSGNDPQNNSQTLSNLLGKLLRIDVNNSTVSNPYAIPTDNPFVGNPSAADEIWAYGLRNPWKFSFDRLTNELWIGDVGQNENEEVNLAQPTDAGLNYGWRCYEGNDPSAVFDMNECPDVNTLSFPVGEYNHTEDGLNKCSITGGYRYRGAEFPNFEGIYFFSDFCSGEIGTLTFESSTWTMAFKDFSGNWAAFGEDVNGELFLADVTSGDIYKLVDNTALNTTNFSFGNIKMYPNPSNNVINIDFSSYQNPNIKIDIFDIHGKLLKSVPRNNNTIQNIGIKNFSSGMYIIKIQNETGIELTQKLIIN